MPTIKSKSATTARTATTQREFQRPTVADARDLIGKMLDYESAAHTQDINLASGRFEMLTNSERQFYRAELIADYIRLSAGNMGNTQGYFDAQLIAFSNKVCDMNIPSHELIGTYLAAVDLCEKEENLRDTPALNEAVRRTMITVLQACVNEMEQRSKLAA